MVSFRSQMCIRDSLEAAPYLMTRQIDEEISGLIQKKLQGQIDVYTGVSIKAVEAPSAADSACVVLSDGRSFPCDLVIVCLLYTSRCV